MRSFIDKLRRKIFSLAGGPTFGSFLRHDVQQDYSGRMADLFFSNKGETVHKWPHYLPIYDKLLGDAPGNVRFLELGVYRGGSMKIWREFFGPDANIFGIDIDPRCAQYDGEHGQVRIGSQDDPEFLRSVVEEMGGVDVILDDGSHIARHQRASFDILFPLLEEGGLYLIEDMHTSYWPTYEGGLRKRGTAIEFLKDKVDLMHRHYFKANTNTADQIPEIESITFFDSIAAIRKQRQQPRYTTMVPQHEE